jgi:hypothetical protein
MTNSFPGSSRTAAACCRVGFQLRLDTCLEEAVKSFGMWILCSETTEAVQSCSHEGIKSILNFGNAC